MGELGKETTEARGGQISPAFVAAPFRIAAASPAASAMNQEGDVKDVRFVKGGGARAIRTLRAATCPEPGDRVVPLSPQMVGLRFTAAAAAGVEHRVTAHSGRVGRASELTSRRASTTDVMLAGNWKTSRDGRALLRRRDRRARVTRTRSRPGRSVGSMSGWSVAATHAIQVLQAREDLPARVDPECDDAQQEPNEELAEACLFFCHVGYVPVRLRFRAAQGAPGQCPSVLRFRAQRPANTLRPP